MMHKARCNEPWSEPGIMNEKNLKKYIDEIFQKHKHQKDVLIDLYRMVLPNWDAIERIEGYPEAGKDLWEFICERFIEFDRKYHPKVFKGGIWLNTGFSFNKKIDPWKVSIENCRITMN